MALVAVCSFGASAAVAAPGGEFAVFKECPIGAEGLKGCLVFHIESGEVKVGNVTVPIVNTQTLQGGFGNPNPETGEQAFYGAENGETLPRTPQPVPSGSVGCSATGTGGWRERGELQLCEAIFGSWSGLYETLELAAPASSIGLNEALAQLQVGTALSLPVKIKLENPLLGNECYIGSDADPIVIELSTGVSGSLKGKVGELASRDSGEILVASDNTLVSNTFAAPEASGCGYRGVLDSLINTKVGLPAPAGANTVVFNEIHEQAGHDAVEEEEANESSTTPPPPPHTWPPHHRPPHWHSSRFPQRRSSR